jgi:hypothetical protein
VGHSIDDYKVYLESLGIDIFESRIIGLDELESLGCSAVNYSCSDAPSWVYATTYWSGTARTSKHLWRIRFDGSLSYSDYASYSYGIRPVIVIDRDILSS